MEKLFAVCQHQDHAGDTDLADVCHNRDHDHNPTTSAMIMLRNCTNVNPFLYLNDLAQNLKKSQSSYQDHAWKINISFWVSL
jgi:hypothetical protein